MIYPASEIPNLSFGYIKRNKATYTIYLLLLAGIILSIIALPFLHTTVSVKSVGNIRPASERTEVHAIVGGIIDSIFYREGDVIQKGQLLLRVKDNVSAGKRMLNGFETQQRNAFIYDLKLLTAEDSLQESILQKLQSPLYREQTSRFLHKRAELQAQVSKADKELEMNTGLAKEKVISPKEFYDYQNQSERLHATFKALQREQLANWQQDLAKFRQELAQYALELTQVNTDQNTMRSKHLCRALYKALIRNTAAAHCRPMKPYALFLLKQA